MRRATPIFPLPLRALKKGDRGYLSFEDNDLAMEWCENRLVAAAPPVTRIDTLGDFALFARLSDEELAGVRPLLRKERYTRGDAIITAGERNDDRIFLLLSGEVSVLLPLPDGTHQRVATLSAGMTFGEMAVLGQTKRTATVYADSTTECWLLEAHRFDELAQDHPRLKIVVLENLAQSLAARLKQSNQLIGALVS